MAATKDGASHVEDPALATETSRTRAPSQRVVLSTNAVALLSAVLVLDCAYFSLQPVCRLSSGYALAVASARVVLLCHLFSPRGGWLAVAVLGICTCLMCLQSSASVQRRGSPLGLVGLLPAVWLRSVRREEGQGGSLLALFAVGVLSATSRECTPAQRGVAGAVSALLAVALVAWRVAAARAPRRASAAALEGSCARSKAE